MVSVMPSVEYVALWLNAPGHECYWAWPYSTQTLILNGARSADAVFLCLLALQDQEAPHSTPRWEMRQDLGLLLCAVFVAGLIGMLRAQELCDDSTNLMRVVSVHNLLDDWVAAARHSGNPNIPAPRGRDAVDMPVHEGGDDLRWWVPIKMTRDVTQFGTESIALTRPRGALVGCLLYHGTYSTPATVIRGRESLTKS